MKSVDDILNAVRFVTICVPDSTGRIIGKKRLIGDWPKLQTHGMQMPDFHLITGIDNRPLSGFSVAGAELGFRNGWLIPDTKAAFLSPLENDTMHVLANAVSMERAPVAESPRSILTAQLQKLRTIGITIRAASELEFYLMRQSYPQAHQMGYSGLNPFYHRHGDNDVLVASLAGDFCNKAQVALEACGIFVDQFQGEGGSGQFEVNVAPNDLLYAADDHIVFKHVLKANAHATGLSVTFLAKPFETDAGSGGHVHISFQYSSGENALGAKDGLTEFGRGFLAGLIAYTPELTLLHAPYANSYKRLAPGAFTPLHSTWGWESRTVMVRLIAGNDGPRLEFRLPGADVNPYHCYAAILVAGLAGVERGLMPPAAVTGSKVPDTAPEVPADLTEAVTRFANSDLACSAFGESTHAHLLQHARHELAVTRRAVTSWEVARGFENA